MSGFGSDRRPAYRPVPTCMCGHHRRVPSWFPKTWSAGWARRTPGGDRCDAQHSDECFRPIDRFGNRSTVAVGLLMVVQSRRRPATACFSGVEGSVNSQLVSQGRRIALHLSRTRSPRSTKRCPPTASVNTIQRSASVSRLATRSETSEPVGGARYHPNREAGEGR